jgi:hypothetical protein
VSASDRSGDEQQTEDFAARGEDASWALPADTPAAEARVGDMPPPAAQTATGARGDDVAAESMASRFGGGSGSIAASLPVGSELAQEKPEVLVAGAFVGAFLFARILKHITSG